MIKRDQAWKKVNELIKNKNLLKHCLAVEAAMVFYADKFNINDEEKEKWAVAGLLHDADYEKYPNKHPQVVIGWLKDEGADEDLINAVEAHGFDFNIPAKTKMAKTLRAVDELTGFIAAVALVRESRKLADVTVKSIRKKWKNKAFAKGVKREDIERGAEEIGIPLEEHIQNVLSAMQRISDELGL